MTRLRSVVIGACLALVLLGSLGSTTLHAQPFSAQIQAALRAFLRQAHTWTATQTFGAITVSSCTGCGGGSAFTTDVTITKADPHVIYTPATATDTRWNAGGCDDAGTDDDDIYEVATTATPCPATGMFMQLISAAANREARFYLDPASSSFWAGLRHNGGEALILEVRGGNGAARTLEIANSTNDGDNAIAFSINGTQRWSFPATAATRGFFLPTADNSYDIGSATFGVRTVYAATSFNLDNNATLRAGTATVGNVAANSCGTTAASLAGNNTAGKITVGATSGTQCRITFSSAWTNAPACHATDETSGAVVPCVTTTTTATITGTFGAADVIAYIVVGY